MSAGRVPQFDVGRRHDAVGIRLLGVPVELHQRAVEHGDELRRELAILRLGPSAFASAAIPADLLDRITPLDTSLLTVAVQTSEELATAMDHGLDRIDLSFSVHPDVGPAARELDVVLDEAEQHCRDGTSLLTLEIPPEAHAYRRWFLHELGRQVDGEPARRWQQR